jgi:hypothetical protein
VSPVRLRGLLATGLAALWSLDALLKLQPAMFSAALFVNVLGPTAVDGQPPWLYRLLSWFDGLWVRHMAVADLGVFLVEAAIAGLLWLGPDRRVGRAGLWALVAWGTLVWVLGEGLGGLVSGDATVLTEAPGASLLYVGAAVLLLLPDAAWRSGRVHRWLAVGMGVFWLLGAALQAQPDFWTAPGLGGVFGDVTMNGPQPEFLAILTNAMLVLAFRAPVALNAALILVMLVLALALLTGAWRRGAEGLAIAFGLFMWACAQGFGGLWTGTATDPGSAVPVTLLTLLALQALTEAMARPPAARGGLGRSVA